METFVYSVVVGGLAIASSIATVKFYRTEQDLKESVNMVRKLAKESRLYYRMYNKEKIENIMLRSENGKLWRELFKAWGVKDEGDV